MKIIIAILVSFVSCFLAGCEPNIPLDPSYWQDPQLHKVAITETKANPAQVYMVGNQGLIDVVINEIMNGQLNNYLHKEDTSWYRLLPNEYKNELKNHHITSYTLDSGIEKDPRAYKNAALAVDANQILILKLAAIGVKRTYYAFIPVAAPTAFVELTGELWDVDANKILWRQKTDVDLPIYGTWSQPPNFPNINQALIRAVNIARQNIFHSLFLQKSQSNDS